MWKNYITCDYCKDKDICPYSGDDPFNWNGGCLAVK